MALILSEEQELLKETAREFIQERSPVSELRKLRDEASADGFSADLWKEMAELGWAGIVFPEEYGGADMGYAELGIVLEECGRTLAATPLISTIALGGTAVLLGGNETQKKDVLTAICEGQRILALAVQEGPLHDPLAIEMRAESAGSGFRLTGKKKFVLDGHVADQIVVAARTSGSSGDSDGLTLFLVDAKASGLKTTRTVMIDGRNVADLEFDSVEVARDEVIGEVGEASGLLEKVLDRATVALSAEMLGSISEAFERTLTYLKERKQFGVPIGSFQALKHRAAAMFIELELSRSVVIDSLQAIDESRADVEQLASLAKAKLSDTAFLVSNEAVQMFGGIGVTDEEDIGLFLKRARVTQLCLGDGAYHRDRFAKLNGF
ncbi:MAG: acyl-CoA dehydrogenase [bacterium]|nr:acyl-CoA dehydrogenase [bacterium]